MGLKMGVITVYDNWCFTPYTSWHANKNTYRLSLTLYDNFHNVPRMLTSRSKKLASSPLFVRMEKSSVTSRRGFLRIRFKVQWLQLHLGGAWLLWTPESAWAWVELRRAMDCHLNGVVILKKKNTWVYVTLRKNIAKEIKKMIFYQALNIVNSAIKSVMLT